MLIFNTHFTLGLLRNLNDVLAIHNVLRCLRTPMVTTLAVSHILVVCVEKGRNIHHMHCSE